MSGYDAYTDPAKRAGHADRDRYVDHLAAMVASGHLKQEEFEQRRDSALEAVTHGNLHDLVRDLPALPDKPKRPTRSYLVAVNGHRCHMKTWLGVLMFFIMGLATVGPVCAAVWHGFDNAPGQGGLPVGLMFAFAIAGGIWGVTMAPESKGTEYLDD